MQQAVADMIRQALEYHQAGRLPEAEAGFRAVLEQSLDPRVAADCYQHLAFVLEDAAHFGAAVEAYSAASRLNPSDPMIHSNHASALIRANAFDEAERVARHAITLFPKSADLQNQLGVALSENGDPAQALRQFERALELK